MNWNNEEYLIDSGPLYESAIALEQANYKDGLISFYCWFSKIEAPTLNTVAVWRRKKATT